MPRAAATVASKSTVARLHDRFDILCDAPVAELRSPTAGAYEVDDDRSIGSNYFALVADPGLPPRGQELGILRMLKHEAILTPFDFGAVDWAPDKRRCLALICERIDSLDLPAVRPKVHDGHARALHRNTTVRS